MKNLRIYGKSPYRLAAIHGGPGAAGEMAPVANALSSHGVLEPFQTADTVQGQIDELKDLLESRGEIPITLIGFSWGAWLSLLLAAQHPRLVKKLILIGSGPLDDSYAFWINQTRMNRLELAEQNEYRTLVHAFMTAGIAEIGNAMARLGVLAAKSDSFDPAEDLEFSQDVNLEAEIAQKVWREAAAMRREGTLMRMVEKVRCPVTAIHGDHDPHPAAGVLVPLGSGLKDFTFILLHRCGHKPWIERHAKERFFEALMQEIEIH